MSEPFECELWNESWSYRVYLLFGVPEDEADKWAEAKAAARPRRVGTGALAQVYTHEGLVEHCVWFRDRDPGSDTIAHEAFHSICWVLRQKGCWPLTAENEEAFAYLLDWTVRTIEKQVPK